MADQRDEAAYLKSIQLLRKEKDQWFQHDSEAPLPESLRGSFQGLSYYPADPAFRVQARLKRFPKPDPITLVTSKGVPRPMVRYGVFEFQLQGAGLRLYAYKSAPQPGHHHEESSLFVPFRDATSGKETYGAARYLDIEEHPGEDYVIDFNLAYNPYCAYSDDYVCPFPPKENWLTAPVRGGEKNFPLH